jgi:hypothetical protein
MRFALRVGVIYNYNTNSEASPNPKNIPGALQAMRPSFAQPGVNMGSKLLFVFGIIVAHGALAAGWVRQEAPQARSASATCVNTPGPLPYFNSRRELLAMMVVPIPEDEAMQP